jgi:hypothetical protein
MTGPADAGELIELINASRAQTEAGKLDFPWIVEVTDPDVDGEVTFYGPFTGMPAAAVWAAHHVEDVHDPDYPPVRTRLFALCPTDGGRA